MHSGPLQIQKSDQQKWISCSEKLPIPSQFVMYRTPQYEALGKLERMQWYFSGHELEPEENPVLYWQPLN